MTSLFGRQAGLALLVMAGIACGGGGRAASPSAGTGGGGGVRTDGGPTERRPDGKLTVGGRLSGLLGAGLVLQNNGGDDLALGADGPFTFATALASTELYAISI